MKNLIIAVLIIALFGTVGYILYQQGCQRALVKEANSIQESSEVEVEKTEDVSEEKIIGGDKDDHGCLIGAGYSWCEEKQKCLRVWEEECVTVSSSKDDITQVMADKHEKSPSEVTITISQEEKNYIRGGVEFAPGEMGNAGMFLAVKTNGEWEIVFDGNGVPDCEALKTKYNFPETTLKGICD